MVDTATLPLWYRQYLPSLSEKENYASFIAARFLLGLAESGFIPGSLWTISTWYTRKETAKIVMVFYFGNQCGQASAKLLAYGILHVRGVSGRPGWFWLFVLMGGFTCFCGFVFGFFLPDSFRIPARHSCLDVRFSLRGRSTFSEIVSCLTA